MLLRQYVRASVWARDAWGRMREDHGATAVEYALMVALIAVVIIAAVAFLGKAASNTFNTAATSINNGS